MGITEAEGEAQQWAKERISHLSYNFECQGEFESDDAMPETLLPDFQVACDATFLSVYEVNAQQTQADVSS